MHLMSMACPSQRRCLPITPRTHVKHTRCVYTLCTLHTPRQVGRLWTSLADYYIRRGLFERARDVYEEGMTTVVTVHDFSLIFDALTQFEESLLAARMEQLGEEGGGGGDEDPDSFVLQDDHDDLDLRCAWGEAVLCVG